MVRAMLFITVKEGQEEAFEQAWRKIAEQVRSWDGNVRQTLLQDPDDRRSFVVASDWESREAFRQFETSPEQDALTAPMRELRESGRMTVHELLVDVEGG